MLKKALRAESQQRPKGQEVAMIENFARELPRFIYTCLAIFLAYELMGQQIASVGQCNHKHQESQIPVVTKLKPTVVKSSEIKSINKDDEVIINGKKIVQLDPIIIRGYPLKQNPCVNRVIAQSEQEFMGSTIFDRYNSNSYIQVWNTYKICQNEIDEYFDRVGTANKKDEDDLVSLLQSYALARYNYEKVVTNIVSGHEPPPDTCWFDDRSNDLYCNDWGVIENIKEYKDTLLFSRIILPEYYNLSMIETDKLTISGFPVPQAKSKKATEYKIFKWQKCNGNMVCNTHHRLAPLH